MQRISFLGAAALGVLLPLASPHAQTATRAGEAKSVPSWVEPMKKVHARFTGTRGTLAQFGDSITVTMAYWSPLAYGPKNMPPEMARALEVVKKYLKPECWAKWKGPGYGNNGSMTIRWAYDNIDKWLQKLNPETALIMFGTNDLGQVPLKEYEEKTRAVVRRCLKNGTVVILSTIPPRHGRLEQARQYAAAVRKVAAEEKVPLIDYFAEILKRRPDDWDGALPKFKETPGSEYEVPTLLARDGVHPSNPSKFRDYSEESLRSNGYGLRNYLSLLAYADVIRRVLRAGEAPADTKEERK
jgi:lysophospholipase L1-like esterase